MDILERLMAKVEELEHDSFVTKHKLAIEEEKVKQLTLKIIELEDSKRELMNNMYKQRRRNFND